jgi:hypothetical protein
MRAKLKALHSPDIDLEAFSPTDPTSFGFLLQAMIGPEDQDGAESFDIEVCTPKWLMERQQSGAAPAVVLGTHMMFVSCFDLGQIRGELDRYCERCVGADWAALANKLASLGAWEFQDYH